MVAGLRNTRSLSFMQVLDLLEHKPIISGGYKAVLHVHSLVEECEITDLRGQIINPKTGETKKVCLCLNTLLLMQIYLFHSRAQYYW